LGMVLQAADLLVIDAGRVRHAGACRDAASHRALEAVFDDRITVRALDEQWVALPR
jgi:iron complex transport system ATP-binding protein